MVWGSGLAKTRSTEKVLASQATVTWPGNSSKPLIAFPNSLRFKHQKSRISGRCFHTAAAERHIGEGSFFVGDDRVVYQSQGGQGVPVVYGGTTLRADGTMTGKRLAA